MSDILRDNPYGEGPDMISGADPRTITIPTQVISDAPEPVIGQQSNGVFQMPEQMVQGSPTVPPVTPPVINSEGAIDKAPTTPLSNSEKMARDVQGLEERKTLEQKEAENLSAGAKRTSDINLSAVEFDKIKLDEQRAMMEKAMADATVRDTALRADIAKAHAYSQSKEAEVDPDRWWNNKSTGGKILAGVGMFLGGVGGGAQGTGRNVALEVMNKAIDDDMRAQSANIKTHIDGNWKAIADKHQLGEDAFNKDLHRQTWENNYRTAAFERVKYQLAASAATTTSESVKNNAALGIMAISKEQDTIRNNQWKLGVAAQQAEAARVRGLMKTANDDVMKLIEKEGVTPDEAEKRVYGSPMFRELIASGRVPQSVIVEQKLHQQFLNQVDSTVRATGMPREEAAKAILQDPKYEVLLKSGDPLVPAKEKTGAEKPQELEARMVDVQVAPGKTVRMPAASKEEANIYREKTGAAQQWDAGVVKLQALNEKSKKESLSMADIAEWNQTRADMIATYGVMKEGSKRLPNEAEKKNLMANVIGNPPIGWGVAPMINPSAMPSVVNKRLDGLSDISMEARKSAGLALTNKPQTTETGGKAAAPKVGDVKFKE